MNKLSDRVASLIGTETCNDDHEWYEACGTCAELMRGVIKELADREANLVMAIRKTLNDNAHLADGDNCTLIDLKNTLKEMGIEP